MSAPTSSAEAASAPQPIAAAMSSIPCGEVGDRAWLHRCTPHRSGMPVSDTGERRMVVSAPDRVQHVPQRLLRDPAELPFYLFLVAGGSAPNRGAPPSAG